MSAVNRTHVDILRLFLKFLIRVGDLCLLVVEALVEVDVEFLGEGLNLVANVVSKLLLEVTQQLMNVNIVIGILARLAIASRPLSSRSSSILSGHEIRKGML